MSKIEKNLCTVWKSKNIQKRKTEYNQSINRSGKKRNDVRHLSTFIQSRERDCEGDGNRMRWFVGTASVAGCNCTRKLVHALPIHIAFVCLYMCACSVQPHYSLAPIHTQCPRSMQARECDTDAGRGADMITVCMTLLSRGCDRERECVCDVAMRDARCTSDVFWKEWIEDRKICKLDWNKPRCQKVS